MGRIAARIAATGLAMSAALLLGGCQAYLHDEALQKQTAAAVAAYKEADVPGAMKANIAAQEKFDEQMLNSLVAEDAAARDLEIAGLLESGDHAALRTRVKAQLQNLGGPNSSFLENDWKDGLAALAALRADLAVKARYVNKTAHQFQAAGGKSFKECTRDMQLHSAGQSEQLKQAIVDLEIACAIWAPLAEALDQKVIEFDQRVCQSNRNSMLAESCVQLAELSKRISDDEAKARETKKGLEKAREDLASEVEKGTPEERLKEKIEAFNAELEKADGLVDELGAPDFKPSAALAGIEFRETNLCDFLLAGVGTSCSGGKVDENAKKLNEAVIGLIAGTSKVTGPPPETDALSIALGYQTGLQGAVQASLEGRMAQRELLLKWQTALVQEVEYLLEARSWLDSPGAKVDESACAEKGTKTGAEKGMATAIRAKGCSARVAFANAITAYNLSWASGRTPARIAYARITMRMAMTNLRVAQATAASRDSMLTTALAGLDAFGQGGVSTQTIAELLQALGVAAVAYGVN